jgi:hypothetical protein
MDNQQTYFPIFVFLSIALAIYGMVCGQWLAKKSVKLADEVKGDRQTGLKALAMWPISILAFIVIPAYIVSLSDHFGIASDQRNILLMITLIPSCLYNIYYRFKLVHEQDRQS